MAKKKENETRGRKKVLDPKMELRFWIETSVVNSNGGKEASKEICIETLKKAVK